MTDTTLSRWICELADMAGSQAALAERCGVTRQAVSQWARGEVVPTDGRIRSIARIAGIDGRQAELMIARARVYRAARLRRRADEIERVCHA